MFHTLTMKKTRNAPKQGAKTDIEARLSDLEAKSSVLANRMILTAYSLETSLLRAAYVALASGDYESGESLYQSADELTKSRLAITA